MFRFFGRSHRRLPFCPAQVTIDTTAVGKVVKKGDSPPLQVRFASAPPASSLPSNPTLTASDGCLQVLPRDATSSHVDNMDDLVPLNAASILENVRIRFR
jgi:hypothetical protein